MSYPSWSQKGEEDAGQQFLSEGWGADVEVEGANVQHAYERGWGDSEEKVAKISVRG